MTDLRDHSHAAGRLKSTWRRAVWPSAVTVLLLCGIVAARATARRTIVDAGPYHEKVREAAGAVPVIFGRWLGVDVPVPQAATTMLKPNVIISRRYDEMGRGGRRVNLLVVQCHDARDILGHFPPVCYPGQGWLMAEANPCTWKIGEMSISGMEYSFRSGTPRDNAGLTVDNFMVLPSGKIVRDMEEVDLAARDSGQKYLGVAQVQLVFDGAMAEADRNEVFSQFAAMLQPFLDAVLQKDLNGKGGR